MALPLQSLPILEFLTELNFISPVFLTFIILVQFRLRREAFFAQAANYCPPANLVLDLCRRALRRALLPIP